MKNGAVKVLWGNLFSAVITMTNKKIVKVVEWFAESENNNRFFTHHNPHENKDVYMVALRNDSGKLIGYYEKHEYRNAETANLYRKDD